MMYRLCDMKLCLHNDVAPVSRNDAMFANKH